MNRLVGVSVGGLVGNVAVKDGMPDGGGVGIRMDIDATGDDGREHHTRIIHAS